MIESDWKRFQAMVPALRERYLAARNAEAAAILTNPAKNETERFWNALERMQEEAKVLQRCLDGHSRSKMWLFMLSMIGVGMLTREDMTGFSEELRREVEYAFERREAAAEKALSPAEEKRQRAHPDTPRRCKATPCPPAMTAE